MTPYPRLRGDEPCRAVDPDLFFPRPGDNRGAQAAKEVCYPCPTRDACAEWALDQGWWLDGIFGALSRKDRDRLRHLRARAIA